MAEGILDSISIGMTPSRLDLGTAPWTMRSPTTLVLRHEDSVAIMGKNLVGPIVFNPMNLARYDPPPWTHSA
jgi:hypothetical protein